MVFEPNRTFVATSPRAGQQGFAPPGAGAQTAGRPTPWPPDAIARDPIRPTQGRRAWLFPAAVTEAQRGFPTPESGLQHRPPGSTVPELQHGGVIQVWTPYYDRGAAAYVPNFGRVLSNPIGAGIVARHRPLASYGASGQYIEGAIWWTTQVMPVSIGSQSLTDPAVLAALLSEVQVQGVVRTTG